MSYWLLSSFRCPFMSYWLFSSFRHTVMNYLLLSSFLCPVMSYWLRSYLPCPVMSYWLWSSFCCSVMSYWLLSSSRCPITSASHPWKKEKSKDKDIRRLSLPWLELQWGIFTIFVPLSQLRSIYNWFCSAKILMKAEVLCAFRIFNLLNAKEGQLHR